VGGVLHREWSMGWENRTCYGSLWARGNNGCVSSW
jgi:hypothetical protein